MKKTNPERPIMIVDDEASILLAVDTTLQMAGMDNTIICQDSRHVMALLEEHYPIEAMLLDLNMPHIDGQHLLDTIHATYPDIPVIIITGGVDVETAVHCIKAGAFDYIVKPLAEERLLTAIDRAMAYKELSLENQLLKRHILEDTLEHPDAFKDIITRNKKMLNIFQYLEAIAKTAQPVLIEGETGVGKELAAISVHQLSGRTGSFTAVNVAGLDDNVFSDTLFGHVKGAFTGAEQPRDGLIEKAENGTLFLDEIGYLSLASQTKLLRLLQEGQYYPLGSDDVRTTNARIITATNQDLTALQERGEFRKDLNYRLQTHRTVLPPLRHRMDDLPLLVDHFLEKAAHKLGKPKPTPPKELNILLQGYRFPGNIRELESIIFDAVSRHKSGVLSLTAIKNKLAQSLRAPTGDVNSHSPSTDEQILTFSHRLPTIKQATRLLINEALSRSNGNQSMAARILGITQQALSKRLINMKSES